MKDLGLQHHNHPLMGHRVLDTATGRTGILQAIAPDGTSPKPVAWLRPEGGGTEWTTATGAIEAAGPITHQSHPKENS
ncbi:hypothetical protein AB0I54_45985 [Streptomyces sp. NPDC050625]|uniref:hypothetical protein n=1 Tax=Streptomyces sp. NPDC050625 TaxID=3154629 RepID=UPI00344848A9